MQLLLRRVVGLAGIAHPWHNNTLSTAAKTDHQEEDSCPSMKYASSFIASFP